MSDSNALPCSMCGQVSFANVFTYDAPPEGEALFKSLDQSKYHREIVSCEGCGHMISTHKMDLEALYAGEYNDTNYNGLEGMRMSFRRITNLDSKLSDNMARCNRIQDYVSEYSKSYTSSELILLDVGSGLGVFPWEMQKRGFNVTAVDPDKTAVEHMREHAIDAVCGSFEKMEFGKKFGLITFNKVLEHVKNPIAMLQRSRDFLHRNAFVYVELPDGECAMSEGPGREEFFIDHLHIFSFASIVLLANNAGFKTLAAERLREPSGKYSLRAFLTTR